MVVFALAVAELCSFIGLRFVVIPRDPSLVYAPPDIDRQMYDQYRALRHPVLGWAPRSKDDSTETIESRPVPSFPNGSEYCVSLYGDSFTFSDEVTDEEAWSNILSMRMGCKAGNFGVSGYGMDQAYLRFALNTQDRAPVSVLGIYPYEVLRNLNQYAFFLTGKRESMFGLKPRFVVEGDNLRLIHLPDLRFEDLVQSTRPPFPFFDHEMYLPGSEHGPAPLLFPYTRTLLRVGTTPAVRNWLLGRPSWIHYLSQDSAGALELAVMIAREFSRLAQERGKAVAVVIFPTVSSFGYFKKTGAVATQPLSDALQRLDVDHFDTYEGTSVYLAERSYCELLVDPMNCSGHYNSEGNRVVADLVYEFLSRRGLLPDLSQ